MDQALDGAQGFMIRALPVTSELPRLAIRDGFLRYVTLEYSHCYIDLGIGKAAYRQKFSAKTRSTMARKIRRYEEHCGGRLPWRVYQSPEDMLVFHGLARQVSVKTYQERLLDAGIPADQSFLTDMTSRAQRNAVRGFILFDGETPVSYLYCPVENRTVIYAYLGYDPAYMKLSVGTVLQWLALEHLFDEACFDLFDFTEGQSDHKRLFATHEQRCANVLYVRRSAWNSILVRCHAGFNALVSSAAARAERWGVKNRLRRLMRFGLTAAKS